LKKIMKSGLLFVLCGLMGLAFSGCGEKEKKPEASTPAVTTEAPTSEAPKTEAVTTGAETKTDGLSDEDKNNMAGGKPVTEDVATTEDAATTTDTVTETGDGISEFCPKEAYETRTDVAYGSYQKGTYYSETCGMDRNFMILLPADYSEEKEYKVMYLLHGIFGNETSFSSDPNNKIKEIVANAVADGIIDDLLVVCPNIYATTDSSLQPGFTAETIAPYDNFANDLVNDLMPYIEENYSVKTGRENTILAGFSMGGRETLYTTLIYPKYFAYVCAISPAPGLVPGKDWAMTHVGSLQEDEVVFAEDEVIPEVLMICCGTKDSVVGQFPKSYHTLMEKNGVEHIWYEITAADHDNNAIRSGLYNILVQAGK